MDVLVVRELYLPTRNLSIRNLSGENLARYSNEDIERVAHVAFKQARSRRKRLTSIDAADVLDSSRIWHNTMTRISRIYPDVELEHMDADTCAISLVANPRYFDVIATPDFFGDLFAGEVAAIAGFSGMLASVTLAGKVHSYEPLGGPAIEIAGRDIANPLGAIAAIAHLLRHSANMHAEACDLETAIRQVVESGARTADLARSGDGWVVGTTEMGLLVEQAFTEMLDRRFAYHAV
jgi:3-isopropylmalate dehydrogenase